VFENAPDIENIFTRITGESASAINGILRTQEGANFFLVNPNGIVFGENAQLDVGGSFIATTADSVQFEDGIEFIASQEQEKPILAVSVPIGLNFEGNNGAITVNGSGNQITNDSTFSPIEFAQRPTGLSVPKGETLALVGSGINFNGGVITNEGGKVYLNSVTSGLANIIQTEEELILSSENVTEYQDINLNQHSLIDASGEKVGNIFLTGKNINLRDNSFIFSLNQGSTSDGTIDIKAFETLTITGEASDAGASSGIRTESLQDGQAIDISVSANQLLAKNAGQIQSATFSNGLGGNVNIDITEQLLIDDSSISTIAFDAGNAGNITLSTSHLRLIKDGVITSSTFGTAGGGKVNINADLINLIGSSSASTRRTNISASSFGSGNAGELTVDTKQLFVKDGASLSSSGAASGNAGNLTINASELVSISGSNPNFQGSSTPESTIRSSIQAASPEGQETLGLPEVPTGDSGNLSLNTAVLHILDKGNVNVGNQGTGDAGKLSINANNLSLDNAGSITAATASGIGGNINLNTDNLQIDEDSQITAEAGNNGDGGNITINTTSLIAKKNSQVTANAFAGRGGNLDINAEGLFLFDSPSNIFSASSELGIDGTIQINTPDIDLQRELEQSELELPTTEEAIAGSCLARSNQQGSFIVNNGTGLPKSPNSNYSDLDSTLTGISSLPQTTKQPEVIEKSDQQSNTSMLRAERMVETEDGRVFLVAAPQEPESLFCPKN
jgi:filamentous hemagglutinin family protein